MFEKSKKKRWAFGSQDASGPPPAPPTGMTYAPATRPPPARIANLDLLDRRGRSGCLPRTPAHARLRSCVPASWRDAACLWPVVHFGPCTGRGERSWARRSRRRGWGLRVVRKLAHPHRPTLKINGNSISGGAVEAERVEFA